MEDLHFYKQNVRQVTSGLLKTYGAETASFISAMTTVEAALNRETNKLTRVLFQIHGKFTTASDLVIARSLTEHSCTSKGLGSDYFDIPVVNHAKI